MGELSKLNKNIKVKELKAYLDKNRYIYGEVMVGIYLEILENFDDEELVPDKILMNLGINPEIEHL